MVTRWLLDGYSMVTRWLLDGYLPKIVHNQNELELNKIHNIKKDIFLAKFEDKPSYISILGSTREKSVCLVLHVEGGADRHLVQTAMKLRMPDSSVVVGDATRVLQLHTN